MTKGSAWPRDDDCVGASFYLHLQDCSVGRDTGWVLALLLTRGAFWDAWSRGLCEGAQMSRASAILVYVLEDPRDGAARYVALVYSRTLPLRYETHVAGHFRSTTGPWCDELRAAGLAPRVRVLKRVPCWDPEHPSRGEWREAGLHLGQQLARLRATGADLIPGVRREGWRGVGGAVRRRAPGPA